MFKHYKICFLILIQIFCLSTSYAQLQASFTIDKKSGCSSSPLQVILKNTSTGTTTSTTYSWDLGNGGISYNSDTVHTTYNGAKIYIIKLTATDGSNTSTYTDTVIVHNIPTADFSSSIIAEKCVPVKVNFAFTGNANEGTITNYLWDFGDGTPSNDASPTHTYTSASKPTVTLTVTNSPGCSKSISKSGITVYPQPKVSFITDTFLCSAPYTVNFNASTSYDETTFGALNYSWSFGDENSSTGKNTSHQYDSGMYTVKLSATNEVGCKSDTVTSNIHVKTFSTKISADSVICLGSPTVISDISSPVPTSRNWNIDGNDYSNAQSFSYSFSSQGTHIITLENQYNSCNETKTKTVLVRAVSMVNGFKIDTGSTCLPITLTLTDTASHTNVKRLWIIISPDGVTKTINNDSVVHYNVTQKGTYLMTLTITDASVGCSSSVSQQFTVTNPVSISHNFIEYNCVPVSINFTANASNNITITSYDWNFGDAASGSNNTSTLANPSHLYNSAGTFTARLIYKTSDRCIDTAFDQPVQLNNRPKAAFTTSQLEVCGSTAIQLTDTSSGNNIDLNYWDWGDGSASTGTNSLHSYADSGFFTITLVARNDWCSDTVIKKNYIHVLPDFPAGRVEQNCDDRTFASFINNSRDVDSLVWNLGDGSSPRTIKPTDTPNPFTYNYLQTGAYPTVLTGYKKVTPLIDTTLTNCIVPMSIPVYVLLKQRPVLVQISTPCNTNDINFKISNVEHNPWTTPGNTSYSIVKFLYKDGTEFSGGWGLYQTFDTTATGVMYNVVSNYDSVRAVISSTNFNCYDTTNYIPITGGLVADFSVTAINCYKQNSVPFVDKSTTKKNIPIVKWTWTYGDGTSATFTDTTKGGDTVHSYPNVQYYYPQLTVVDSSGCTSTASNTVLIDGPKADFNFTPTDGIIPNTLVTFTNTSKEPSGSNIVNYRWYSKQWNTSTNFNAPKYSYGNTAPDTVTLIASSPTAACKNDTITKIIPVQKISVAFTDSSYYPFHSDCPPLIVNFKNNSVNTTSIKWTFGDGPFSYSTLDDPQHQYTTAGDFRVVLYGYGNNGYVDSAIKIIHIPGPIGSIKSNITAACSPATFQFTINTNAKSYSLDFRDGNVPDETGNTVVNYTYTRADSGKYIPQLIMSDDAGCTYSIPLADTLIVDSLHVNVTHSPLIICDSGNVDMKTETFSISKQFLSLQPTYQWKIENDGNTTNTSTLESPQFYFNKVDSFYARLHATSQLGCSFDTVDVIHIRPSYKGDIAGNKDVCFNTPEQYSATPATGDSVNWQWNFNNGNVDTGRVPSVQKFLDTTSGYTHNIALNVTMDGCSSTLNKLIWVHGLPSNILSAIPDHLCKGDSMQLVASGGIKYLWQPSQYLNSDSISNPKASPPVTTNYTVTATNQYGCSNSDSAQIQVIQPVKITATPDTFVCKNSSVQLNAEGANSYLWTDNGFINDIHIPNPIVTPSYSTTFNVTGYSLYNCFTDTAKIFVDVKNLPTADFSYLSNKTLQVAAGDDVILQPIYSGDVINYLWTPDTYLNCNTCPNPVASPRSNIAYKVQVQNQYQCTASDSVSIILFCSAAKLYVPSAFTPNGDGRNDVFYLMGKGIKHVIYFKIFDRWGNLIFQKYNFNVNDATSGWDGTYNNMRQNPGTYVYEAQVQCDVGDLFNFKGTVVLIR